MSEILPGTPRALDNMTRAELEAELNRVGGEDIDRREYLRTLHELGSYREQVAAQTAELAESRKQLQAASDRYTELFDFAPVGYVTLNHAGMIAEVNLIGATLLGRPRAALVGGSFPLYVAPADRETVYAHLRECREADNACSVEIGLRAAAGTIPVQLSTRYVKSEFRIVILDLSDRLRAEQELQEQHDLLGLALSTALGGAWRFELRSHRLQWSPEHFELFRLPRIDFVGLPDWLRAVHPQDRARLELEFERFHYQGGDFECEYRAGPEARSFITRGRLFDGDDTALVGITLDVTEARRNEESLRALNRALGHRTQQLEATMQRLQQMTAELARAEQRERQSLALLLHDHLQQLLVAARYKTSADCADKDEDWMQDALGTVDGLLEEAIQASRTLTVELSPPVLNDANLEQSLQWLARWMEEKHHLAVELRVSPMPGQSDQHKWLLFQLARELLFNVAKHSGVNEAVLTIGEQEREWRLVVEDEGKGFESDPVEFTSSGFGLFSMGQRLSAYGGRVFVHSSPGEGCRVEIRVPTDPASPQKASTGEKGESMPQPANGKHRRIRVLLADDHDILRSSLANLLRSENDIEVVGEACDGEAALEMANALEPDVVLMDITMPRLNGIEATRRIVHDHPATRVVALSMHSPADLSESMRDAGAVGYVSKSAPISDLLNAIRVPAG